MNTLRRTIYTTLLLLLATTSYSQSASSDTTNKTAASSVHTYPEVKGYVGIVVPIYTLSNDGNRFNGEDYFTIGNPWGINIWKSKRFGFSFELTPLLRISDTENRVSNILFHPGVLYRLGHEYTLIGRVAYETSGRYGFTPIINKVVKRTAQHTFFVAALLPVRFGNDHEPSITAAFQFGLGF